MRLDLVTIVVRDYDEAVAFFCGVLGFELAQDDSDTSENGRTKRWVVVRPPDGGTGLLLARAQGPQQEQIVGSQVAGRVGFFLHVTDFDAVFRRLVAADVEIVRPPRTEPFGRVAVFAASPMASHQGPGHDSWPGCGVRDVRRRSAAISRRRTAAARRRWRPPGPPGRAGR